MKADIVQQAAMLLHRMSSIGDWIVTVEKSDDPFWRLVEFESALVQSFSSSTAYGEYETDGALVFSRLEMIGLLKIIEDNTRQRLAALGVELES